MTLGFMVWMILHSRLEVRYVSRRSNYIQDGCMSLGVKNLESFVCEWSGMVFRFTCMRVYTRVRENMCTGSCACVCRGQGCIPELCSAAVC